MKGGVRTPPNHGEHLVSGQFLEASMKGGVRTPPNVRLALRGSGDMTCFNEGRRAHAAESRSRGVAGPPVSGFNEGRRAHAAESGGRAVAGRRDRRASMKGGVRTPPNRSASTTRSTTAMLQ